MINLGLQGSEQINTREVHANYHYMRLSWVQGPPRQEYTPLPPPDLSAQPFYRQHDQSR